MGDEEEISFWGVDPSEKGGQVFRRLRDGRIQINYGNRGRSWADDGVIADEIDPWEDPWSTRVVGEVSETARAEARRLQQEELRKAEEEQQRVQAYLDEMGSHDAHHMHEVIFDDNGIINTAGPVVVLVNDYRVESELDFNDYVTFLLEDIKGSPDVLEAARTALMAFTNEVSQIVNEELDKRENGGGSGGKR